MTVFEVTSHELRDMNPEKAVGLIRKLVWADASASGIRKSLINIPTAINVADGGIDGEVDGASKESVHGIIKKGITRYQIKSGDFNANDIGIKQILFKENSEELKDRIKSCLDKDGTFVIVFTGWDNPDRSDDSLLSKFRDKLVEVSEKYKDAKMEIWRQNKILSYLEHFPALKLYVLDLHMGSLLFYEDWFKRCDEGKMYLGSKQNKFIEDVRKELRENDRPVHIRVIGEPGIGKTRAVLEAVNDEDLKHTVVYCEDPKKLEERSFLGQICSSSDRLNMILVVDECSFNQQASLWGKLESKSPDIKLITIFNEPDDSIGHTRRIDLPGLEDNEIAEIITYYTRDKEGVAKWVEFCRPSPRAAHIVGRNLSEHHVDLLRSPDTVDVWNRYIARTVAIDTEEFKNRRTVMLWLSIFKKFGFEGQFMNEGNKIAEIIEKNSGMKNSVFVQTVNKLRKMKIIQGSSTLYITPKLLHVYFWVQWWEEYGENLMNKVVESLTADRGTESLFGWYCEMFEYARQAPQASNVVSKMFKPGGFFDNNEVLKTRLGANFFLILSRTDSSSALDCLERIIKRQSREELLEFTDGRREIVYALERMALFRDTFEKTADLLLLLAEAENERYSNNATGTFCDLFVPGTGRASKTEVSPKDRIPALEKAFGSDSKLRTNIGIEACNRALQKMNISVITSNLGAFEKHPQLWTPESDGEIITYYKSILELLARQTKELDRIGGIILENFRHMVSIPMLDVIILNMVKKLHAEDHLNGENIVEEIIQIIDFDRNNLEPSILEKLVELQNEIIGTGYHSMMRRYVGMNVMLDWRHEAEDNEEPRKAEIDELVAESLDPKKLKPELGWLVTNEAKYGYVFGYELAKKDAGYLLLPAIMDALKNAKNQASGFFVGGYFRYIFEDKPQVWEDNVKAVYDDLALCRVLPEILCRSRLTDKTAGMISCGIKEGKFGYDVLGMFGYSGVIGKISEKAVLEWIHLLLSKDGTAGIIIAMNIFHAYFIYHKQKPLPIQVTLELLLHKNIVHGQDISAYDVMSRHYWKEIGMKFVRQHPQESINIAEAIITNMGKENFFDYFNPLEFEVLDEIVRIKPGEAWKIISKCMGPPMDKRAYRIQKWMQGGNSFDRNELSDIDTRTNILSSIPVSEITAWIEKDSNVRAGYMAKFLPTEFPMIREFLAKYPDQKDVWRQIAVNFDNEGWSGPATIHYEEKKKRFERLRDDEEDKNVREWLNYYIKFIEGDIRRSREMEERELQIL